jgi:hypothetical protein
MSYIPRRLAVTNEKGQMVEYSDTDFFAINAPLVLLGEPGSGKSTLVAEFHKISGSPKYNASSINMFPPIDEVEPTKKIIIDGIDEVIAYEAGASISIRVLSKIAHHTTPNFVLVCRAADWQDSINNSIILDRWQKKPVIGCITPLNDQEIIAFIKANETNTDPFSFIQEAQKRDILELLRNPQNLTLFLNAIQNNEWPNTKLELYEYACLSLIKEDNEHHAELNKNRPNPEELINAAGFIFGQMLLSGYSEISFREIKGSITPTMLAASNFDIATINCALATKLFRSTENNILEPCHRTIAEFMAAKYLSNSINKKQLSIRRLESVLYGSYYTIPTALRGLHAWLATINLTVRDRFIDRDPYGLIRYGDPSVLTLQQSQKLLLSLEKIAEIDPYFRSEDWHITLGRGIAKPELQKEIVRILCSTKTNYQLSHLILESMCGDEFANNIIDILIGIVLNLSKTPIERKAAANVLIHSKKLPDFTIILKQLCVLNDYESLRIALFIIQSYPIIYNGITIAEIFNALAILSQSDDSLNLIGLGHGIYEKLSIEQLEVALNIFSKTLLDTSEVTTRFQNAIKEWVYRFSQERIKRSPSPSPSVAWSWLKHIDRFNRHSHQNEPLNVHFSQNDTYRQLVQAEAINEASDADALWMILWDILETSFGLWLREDDIMLHMTSLFLERNSEDWPQRWKILVQWSKSNRNSSGCVIEHANKQANNNNILQSQLRELERATKENYENRIRKQKHQVERRQIKDMEKRHQSYREVKEQLSSGMRIDILHSIATAYLGRYSNIHGKSPIDRIAHLIGAELIPLAIDGIKAASIRADIPTPREMIELRIIEKKHSFFESILLVYCDILNHNNVLIDLPSQTASSALAACQWDLQFTKDDITPNIRKQLEVIVFKSPEAKRTFIRDTIEPYLGIEEQHISGLFRITNSEEFSDVIGELSIEWLKKYTTLPINSLKDILHAAIYYAPQNEITSLVHSYIQTKQWVNEEQKNLWFGALFLLNFHHHIDLIERYASETKEHLWTFKSFAFNNRNNSNYWPKLKEQQQHFIISKFGSFWPLTDTPIGSWSGDQNPWDASRFIQKLITDLSENTSDEAENLLSNLIEDKTLSSYNRCMRHAHTQQLRQKNLINRSSPSLKEIRGILLKGEPENHHDLQALLIDELEALQQRIKDSPTNDILTFWDGEAPHDENYCRDRIVSMITPYIDRYNIRAHTEGTMPNNNRCDLLNTHLLIDLPLEIKGQWHPKIWSAGSDQLSNYTKAYRANGYGIYLVLWFGELNITHNKNPRGAQGLRKPKTYEQMCQSLNQRYNNISEKTKIFVMDLSKNT